jgi:hypothetical protein
METVYLACYNPMIHESGYITLSVHKTRKRAEMAIEFHKALEMERWKDIYQTEEDQLEYPFGKFEAWNVFETKLEE